MKKSALIIFLILSLISCNQKEEQPLRETNNQNGILEKHIELQNGKISKNKIFEKNENDTLTIKNTSAIIYEPTGKSIEKRKKEVGEEDFYIGADDYLFYLNDSNKYLESQKIKIVMTKSDKVLKFISTDKSVTIIKLELEKEIWGIYLFDPKQKPKRIDMTAIAEEYKKYTQ
ncbi:hypothetical protein [Flavobacterium sp.]|uniref:hypothetical protein n=1 Tax=Flavobacterium sp. TaxID=239 RepID=UPI00286A8D0B|nr:hypothetical protein [Flavobacterium sp.]